MSKTEWPRIIKSGSAVVKVYRGKHSKTRSGFIYTLAYVDLDKVRRTPQFADPDEALKEAAAKAKAIASGRPEMADFSRSDRDELVALRKLAGAVKPVIALQEWARARELAGEFVVEAAKEWALRHRARKKSQPVGRLVDEFIAAKEAAHYQGEQTYRRKLRQFQERFADRDIASIMAPELREWLAGFGDPVYHNDQRTRLTTFFRWARKRGALPTGVQLEIEMTDRAKEVKKPPGIINAATMGALLEAVRKEWPQDLAAIVLACLCGLRSDEIHGKREDRNKRQIWEDVFLDRGFLRVTAAKNNTPAWRNVPICPAAVAWLKTIPERDRVGYICEPLAVDRCRRTGKSAGLKLPPNCFRHSFISHRIPVLDGNKPQVATEAGNSVKKIDQSYRVPLTKEEGVAWFEVRPA